MKLRELIEELNKYPNDMFVKIIASYDEGFGHAGGTIQYIEKEDNTICLDQL